MVESVSQQQARQVLSVEDLFYKRDVCISKLHLKALQNWSLIYIPGFLNPRYKGYTDLGRWNTLYTAMGMLANCVANLYDADIPVAKIITDIGVLLETLNESETHEVSFDANKRVLVLKTRPKPEPEPKDHAVSIFTQFMAAAMLIVSGITAITSGLTGFNLFGAAGTAFSIGSLPVSFGFLSTVILALASAVLVFGLCSVADYCYKAWSNSGDGANRYECHREAPGKIQDDQEEAIYPLSCISVISPTASPATSPTASPAASSEVDLAASPATSPTANRTDDHGLFRSTDRSNVDGLVNPDGTVNCPF